MPPNAKLILLVDDDTDVREATADLLLDMGYRAVSASGGVAALELLERGLEPGVMLVDLAMPGMTGEEFMLALEQRKPQLLSVPRIFVSGSREPEGLLERTGAMAFVSKPLDDKKLARLLDQAGLQPARA